VTYCNSKPEKVTGRLNQVRRQCFSHRST